MAALIPVRGMVMRQFRSSKLELCLINKVTKATTVVNIPLSRLGDKSINAICCYIDLDIHV